jgi:hypothetical protein
MMMTGDAESLTHCVHVGACVYVPCMYVVPWYFTSSDGEVPKAERAPYGATYRALCCRVPAKRPLRLQPTCVSAACHHLVTSAK